MPKHKNLDVTLAVNGKSMRIGHVCLYESSLLFRHLPTADAAAVVNELAMSDCYLVRRHFTSHLDSLSIESLEALLNDPVEEVVYWLLESMHEKQFAMLDQNIILSVINRSPMIAYRVARSLDNFPVDNPNINLRELFTILLGYPDSGVRSVVAEKSHMLSKQFSDDATPLLISDSLKVIHDQILKPFKNINATLIVNGQSRSIDSFELNSIVGSSLFWKLPGSADVLAELAQSDYFMIRVRVGCCEYLHEETIYFLLNNPVEMVVRTTLEVNNGVRLRLLNDVTIKKIINGSPKIAEVMANYIDKKINNNQYARNVLENNHV